MKLSVAFVLIASVVSLTGCGKKAAEPASTAKAEGLVKIRFQTDWYP